MFDLIPAVVIGGAIAVIGIARLVLIRLTSVNSIWSRSLKSTLQVLTLDPAAVDKIDREVAALLRAKGVSERLATYFGDVIERTVREVLALNAEADNQTVIREVVNRMAATTALTAPRDLITSSDKTQSEIAAATIIAANKVVNPGKIQEILETARGSK